MESWIRYSVAVYIGLLLAGAAMYSDNVRLGPSAWADTGWYYPPQNSQAWVNEIKPNKFSPPAQQIKTDNPNAMKNETAWQLDVK